MTTFPERCYYSFMNKNLFKYSNTASLSTDEIKSLNTERLKAYRRKLLKTIHKADHTSDKWEPNRYLFPNDDWSHIETMEEVLKKVNKEFSTR